MGVETIITYTLTALPTIAYYAILLLLSAIAFIFAFVVVFIQTPGEFVHPYYAEGSGFGNDHSVTRGYPRLRGGGYYPPPIRMSRGRGRFIKRIGVARPRFY
ncbi:hypothetical protein TWF718_009328 [Orbilia javanica]|uniref:Uncharacterized protein n=1 Tax=Orbilia javanica TaxID=47235 RepID=A0AAN8MZJ9_9PEZI